jgi:hypothetical protein
VFDMACAAVMARLRQQHRRRREHQKAGEIEPPGVEWPPIHITPE